MGGMGGGGERGGPGAAGGSSSSNNSNNNNPNSSFAYANGSSLYSAALSLSYTGNVEEDGAGVGVGGEEKEETFDGKRLLLLYILPCIPYRHYTRTLCYIHYIHLYTLSTEAKAIGFLIYCIP